jgi:hypothetical protein
MNRPNLFDFATSELSQDAFLCWLLSWAHREQKANDTPLHQAGVSLLGKLLALHGIKAPAEYGSVEVERQHRDIDILVLVNDDIALPIEDKVYAGEHSNQLTRYLDIVRQDFRERKKVAPVYFKTGDQSNYGAVKAAGWKCFLRPDLLDVLKYGEQVGVTSDIFRDFHCRLRRREEAVQRYREAPIGEWDRDAWTGFFVELQKRLNDGVWGHVPFPGDFMGSWWHWKGNKYLQLEETELCFKIHVSEKEDRRAARQTWHQVLMEESRNSGLTLIRPARFGNGNYMTVAVLDRDYRQAVGEVLSLDPTVELLRKAERLLDSAVVRMSEATGPHTVVPATADGTGRGP